MYNKKYLCILIFICICVTVYVLLLFPAQPDIFFKSGNLLLIRLIINTVFQITQHMGKAFLVICTIIIKGNIVIVDKDSLIIHFVCDKAFFFFAIKSHDPLTRNIIHTPVPVAVCHFRICKKPQCNTDISGMSSFNNGSVCAPVLCTYVKFISVAFI